MKLLIIKSVVAIAAFGYVLSTPLQAQEKKVHVKKVMVEDGEKKVIDTVFTVKEGDNEKEIIKTFTWTSDDGEAGDYTFDVKVDVDADTDKKKKVIVIKSSDDVSFDGDKSKKRKIKVITDGDENQVFVVGSDDEETDQNVFVEVIKIGDSLQEMQIKLENEMIILEEQLSKLESELSSEEFESLELEVLAEIDELKKLKNIEVIMPEFDEIEKMKDIKVFMHDGDHDHDFVWYDYHHGNSNPTEKEIRDAGVDIKVNRLELEDLNINIDNGVLDVEFTTAGEATPKVTVYNFYGDKVISVKPELLNGTYSFKVDLSNKQHGTYYIHIVSKDSSVTKKIKI